MLTPVSKVADVVSITAAAYVSQLIVYGDNASFSHIDWLHSLLGMAVSFITFDLFRVYRPYSMDSVARSAARAVAALLVAQTIVAAVSLADADSPLRIEWLLCWTALTALLLVLQRCAMRVLPTLVPWRGLRPAPVAIVVSGSSNIDLLARVAPHARASFVPELIFDPTLTGHALIDNIPAVNLLCDFTRLVREHRLREVWIVNAMAQPGCAEQLLEAFRHDFINIRVLPALPGPVSAQPIVGEYRGVKVLNLVAAPDRGLHVLPKEIFDRLFALCTVIALSPLFIAIALAVKCSSPGPVLFRQYRKGMNGDVFAIYKFRTMYQGADQPGTVTQARKGDARVTPVGALLRRTSLDELPQFLNVLKGEMSVVGPRPHAVEHDDYYKDLVENYMYRYRIKPGITGWAQINGYRGETAQIEKMEGRVLLDIHYIQHWTLWMDMKIIALTLVKGFLSNAAY
jgi:putative colanic acid biosynthesis UDP-glucose lipid carrier transferase